MTIDAVATLLAGRSVSLRKKAMTLSRSLNEAERAAIAANPAAARRHAWLALSPHTARLRKDPYAIHAFEDDDGATGRDSLELRDWFSATFACAPEATRPGSAPPREAFAAWRVFQERRHSGKIYLPRATVASALAAQGFAPGAADAALVSAAPSTGSHLVTHAEFAKMQAAVRACVRGATVVDPSLPSKLDLEALDSTQVNFARELAATPFSCLNGRAGTGKTTLVSAVVAASLAAGVHVVCLAPTHRAKGNLANRLPPSVSVATIDAFIKGASTDGAMAHARRLVIVDESSMVCLVKFARLARAIMVGAWQVCLVGDAGQLEPIGRGEMFRTALEKGGLPQFELKKCYRAKNVDLFDAQTAIRAGTLPGDTDSVSVRLLDTDNQVDNAVAQYVAAHGAHAQYIAWTNRTCDMVNRLVQTHVHGVQSVELKPRAGDRVVYIGRNLPRKGLTNAMVGDVSRVSGATVVVEFEGGAGEFECAAKDVALAYCLTVHKAQGSEFPRVCVVATCVDAMSRCLDRRWLYTAVSRARARCDVVATKNLAGFVAAPVRKREPVGVSFASTV